MGATFATGVGRTEARGRPSARSGLGDEAPPAKRSAATGGADPWPRGSGRFGRSTNRLEKARVKTTTKSAAQTWVRTAGGRASRGGPRGAKHRCKERSDWKASQAVHEGRPAPKIRRAAPAAERSESLMVHCLMRRRIAPWALLCHNICTYFAASHWMQRSC